MAHKLAELCTILVENAYGHLASQIFSALAHHGRQALPALQQLTRLPLRRLKTALGILIQQHILYHHRKRSDDEEEDEREPTFFSINWNATYCLLRNRKIVKLVAEREGETAGSLIGNILQLGHASIGDLTAEYDHTPSSKRDSGIETFGHPVVEEGLVNGITDGDQYKTANSKITKPSQFHSLTRTLLTKGYLVKVGGRTFMPREDLHEHIKDTVIETEFPDGKITGAKKAVKYQEAFNHLKRKYDDEDAYRAYRDDASHGEIKRAQSPSHKRVRLNGHMSNGAHHLCDAVAADEDDGVKVAMLSDDMVVRVDLNKCTSLLRAVLLEKMANRHLGPVTAAVYGAVLGSIGDSAKYISTRDKVKAESEDSDEDEDEELPSVSDVKVLDNLSKGVSLDSTIKRSDPQKLTNDIGDRKRRHVLSDDPDEAELGIKREAPSDQEEDNHDSGISAIKKRNKKLTTLNEHLNLLAEHPNKFILRRDGKHESSVDITSVTDRLISTELDTMVQVRYGKHSIRIIRLLRDKGKLADTQIIEYCMLDQKYVRTLLTKLQFDGILDIQEVPKDNMRQPSRTLYLWSLNEERLESIFLEQTYRTMTRMLQRMQAEREGRFRAVIERAEHISANGREEKEFSVTEREMLRQWREMEEKVMVQVARCDDVVAVLRDFREDDGMLQV